jgi:hypothetical protein
MHFDNSSVAKSRKPKRLNVTSRERKRMKRLRQKHKRNSDE